MLCPQLWHLPITEASRQLGIGVTQLKRVCRERGISAWPARKLRSMDVVIAAVEQLVAEEDCVGPSVAVRTLDSVDWSC